MADDTRVSRAKNYLYRMTILLAAGMVFCGVIWTSACVIYTFQLDAEAKRWHVEGLPLTVADIKTPQVSGQQNAAYSYMRALDIRPNHQLSKQTPDRAAPLGSISQENKKILSRVIEDKFTETDFIRAREVLSEPAVDRALRGCANATDFSGCKFPTYQKNAFSFDLPHIESLHEMVRLASAKAVISALDGAEDDAIYWLNVAIRIANHMTNTHTLPAQLLAADAHNVTTAAFAHIANKSHLSATASQQLRAALATTDLYRSFDNSLRMEAALWLSVYGPLHQGGAATENFAKRLAEIHGTTLTTILSHAPPVLTRPFLLADQAAYMKSMRRQYTAANQPWYIAKDALTSIERSMNRIPKIYIAHMHPSLLRSILKRDDAQARVDMSRIIIAIETYRDAHGTYPRSLSELQSDINWDIPIDPFSGTAYVYYPDGPSFILYSLGPDCDDDNGQSIKLPVSPSGDGDIVALPTK